jgi:hypothetical protein
MLYREGGGAPTHLHKSVQSARREAERLAKELGVRIYVLEAIAVVARREFDWNAVGERDLGSEFTDDGDETPF